MLAACDSSRKLRLWAALRAAVKARRRAKDPHLNPPGADREAGFGTPVARDAELNAPRPWYDPAGDQR